MNERMRARDFAFLAEESSTAPRHNATLEIFEPGDSGFDYDRLVQLVSDRISFVPRYRQRLVSVPGKVAMPLWVDDENFDLSYHLRRSALPRPGTEERLIELVQRIMSRELDRARPLWEIYFVEGLAGGRVALLSKSHQALVDGIHTVDLGQLILDPSPEPKVMEADDWQPVSGPSSVKLVAAALRDTVTHPKTALDSASVALGSARDRVGEAQARTRAVLGAMTGRKPRPNAIGGPLSRQRRLMLVDTDLSDYRSIRDAHGGTINDVILATLTGALRMWLMSRSEAMYGIRKLRAVVPVSVIDKELEATSVGSQIAPHYVDLPIGEASPVVRLHQVSYSFQAHKDTGRSVAANRLAGVAGFAPTTFHAIGSRVAFEEARRGYRLSVTNVPGPQAPLYAAGAKMVASYPVHPLVEGIPVAIGVTSYNGRVCYGITTDRDRIPDADTFAACLTDALAELLDTATGGRARAPRGRRGTTTRQSRRSSQ